MEQRIILAFVLGALISALITSFVVRMVMGMNQEPYMKLLNAIAQVSMRPSTTAGELKESFEVCNKAFNQMAIPSNMPDLDASKSEIEYRLQFRRIQDFLERFSSTLSMVDREEKVAYAKRHYELMLSADSLRSLRNSGHNLEAALTPGFSLGRTIKLKEDLGASFETFDEFYVDCVRLYLLREAADTPIRGGFSAST